MTAEPARKIEEAQDVMKEVVSVEDQAKVLKVIDSDSYITAGNLWKTIKAIRAKVAEAFDGNIKKAHELHKGLITEKKRHDEPLDRAERAVKRAMSDYDAEKERIRQAEQRRLEEEARRVEEERRKAELERLEAERRAEEERLIAAAEAAERAGNVEKAETLTQEAIETTERAREEAAFIASTPPPPPQRVVKDVPKLRGGPVFQTRWSAEVTNVKALCLAIGQGSASTEYVIGLNRNKEGVITSPALNAIATRLMSTLDIPGVKAVSKRV